MKSICTIISITITIILTFGFLGPVARAQTPSTLKFKFETLSFDQHSGSLNLRIGIQNPVGEPIGDVLYIHGFADRLDNHGPLFSAWTNAGLRVISFDLPSHGENSGTYNNINKFTFENLAKLAATVEQLTKPENLNRPLILAGWSTGGLIIVRALQENWITSFSRPIAGVILFTPGIGVRKFPWTFGNKLGMVTQETLTHDPHPPHVGKIKPSTPFWNSLAFRFAPSLLFNSVKSQSVAYPSSIKTLVFSGGDKEDVYAKSYVIRDWVSDQNSLRQEAGGPSVLSVRCPHAAHEIDNELPQYGGTEVRAAAAEFASMVSQTNQQPQGFNLNVCF